MQTKSTKLLTFLGHKFSQIFGTIFLSLFLSFSFDLNAQDDSSPSFDPSIVKNGESLFKGNCTVCHAINEVVIGPALRDVHERQSEEWIYAFIKNSQKVIKSGDEYAVNLYNEYNKDFITVMPTNLYGPNDNYDLDNSHVLAALIKKITNAKKYNKESIEIWGTGKPKRDFLHVSDLADAVCFLAENYSSAKPINIGSSKEISIEELAQVIAKIVGWSGQFKFNKNMPDGTMLKKLDTSRINTMGWSPKIDIKSGIRKTIEEYLKSHDV